jgi:hypothetical protein
MQVTGGMLEGKPRTGLGAPKHGKEAPKNEPHVGGNTWAGGTGGSDTAGLGGRGGPYRLDKGHAVHQVSDADKAAVSDESKRRARALAEAAYEEKLKEIDMGAGDYETYRTFRDKVRTVCTVFTVFTVRTGGVWGVCGYVFLSSPLLLPFTSLHRALPCAPRWRCR